VPVIGTTEVGAIENVRRSVATAVAPGDVQAMAAAIVEMAERARTGSEELESLARAEAQRLFAPEIVCRQISVALEDLVGAGERVGATVAR
jgi:glycosyltransferase involved in cell wall biosynthesis